MMPSFNKNSKNKKKTCHKDLQDLFDAVIERRDCTVLDGHRSVEKQQEKYESGASKVKHSKHNCEPSMAIDVAPYPIPDNWGKVSWGLIENKEHREEIQRQVKELHKFYHFAGCVQGTANRMNIDMRWGGDWDGDNNFNDQTFDDLVHFEKK